MNTSYSELSKEELIKKIEEISKELEMHLKEHSDINRNNSGWAANLGRWQWDLEHDKVVFNDKRVTALGYLIEEIPDDIDFEFFISKIHPDDCEMVKDNLQKHISGDSSSYEVEYRIQTKAGDYKWYYDRGVVTQRDENGRSLILEGTVFDITERKLQEERNEILAKLPFSNPDIVIIMNLTGQVEYLNPAGQNAVDEDIYELLPQGFISKLAYSCNNGELQTINYSRNDKDYLLKIRPFAEDEQCMVTISDVTEFLAITKEKNLYYEALQSVNQPMFITDIKGKILKVNGAFERLYGYPKEEIIGQKPNILNAGKETYLNLGYSENDYDDLFRRMWLSIKDPNIGTWDGTVINRNKDGEVMWTELKINAIVEEGEIVNYISLPIDITNSVANTNQAKQELYQAIANLAEMRDDDTGSHMRRVGIYSRMIAKKIGFREKLCDDIETFAPMHDLGKVGIPDSILLAERKLTIEEFEVMKKHTILGYNIVGKNPDMSLVAEVAYGHHEKYDGSGYPQGIKGEEIPIVARIVALADVYDALRSKRPYKKEWSHEDAMDYIVSSSGSHFDPKVVDAFIELNDKFKNVFTEVVD